MYETTLVGVLLIFSWDPDLIYHPLTHSPTSWLSYSTDSCYSDLSIDCVPWHTFVFKYQWEKWKNTAAGISALMSWSIFDIFHRLQPYLCSKRDDLGFFKPQMDKLGWAEVVQSKKLIFVYNCSDGPKRVLNGRKHLGWPFWSLLDPFGPLWNVDKPAMFGPSPVMNGRLQSKKRLIARSLMCGLLVEPQNVPCVT